MTPTSPQNVVKGLRGCNLCVLPEGSYPVTPDYVGQRVLLIGQAPGKEELRQGRPFAGPAGKTLFRWFQEAGLGDEMAVRRRVFFAAVAHCWPGTRDGSSDDLPPTPQMRRNCRRHLDALVRAVEPALLVAVGALGAEAVLKRKRPLSAVVGPLHEVDWLGARRAIVLPHPSGLSRWLNAPENQERHRIALERLSGALSGNSAGVRKAVGLP